MCTKCRHVFMVQADFEQFYTFAQPVTCPNPTGCNSYKFGCLSGGSEPAACRDYQEIKIQEQVGQLSMWSSLFYLPNKLFFIMVLLSLSSDQNVSNMDCTFGHCKSFHHRYRGCQWAVFLGRWWWFWKMTWSTVVNLVRIANSKVKC